MTGTGSRGSWHGRGQRVPKAKVVILALHHALPQRKRGVEARVCRSRRLTAPTRPCVLPPPLVLQLLLVLLRQRGVGGKLAHGGCRAHDGIRVVRVHAGA